MHSRLYTQPQESQPRRQGCFYGSQCGRRRRPCIDHRTADTRPDQRRTKVHALIPFSEVIVSNTESALTCRELGSVVTMTSVGPSSQDFPSSRLTGNDCPIPDVAKLTVLVLPPEKQIRRVAAPRSHLECGSIQNLLPSRINTLRHSTSRVS